MTPRLNPTSATPQPQSMRSKRHPSRHPSHLRRRQSHYRLCNPLYQRGRKREWYGLPGQERQTTGCTEAGCTTPSMRIMSSITLSRDRQQHPILVGHSQFPNTKIAIQSPRQPATLRSQETTRMTSPLVEIESNQALARSTPSQTVPNYPTTSTFAQTRAVKVPIQQTTNRYHCPNATKDTRSSALTSSRTSKILCQRTSDAESQVVE